MSSFRKTVKRWLPPVIVDQLRRSRNRGVREQRLSLPDADLYKPLFSPWLGLEPFAGIFEKARGVSLVSADRCWVLYTLAKQAMSLPGEIWKQAFTEAEPPSFSGRWSRILECGNRCACSIHLRGCLKRIRSRFAQSWRLLRHEPGSCPGNRGIGALDFVSQRICSCDVPGPRSRKDRAGTR